MIVVIGRPAVDEAGELQGQAALICLAAAETGAAIELVGSVGDDSEGDAVAIALGRAGVGHAALLRDPAGATPRVGSSPAGPHPRLDARDIELGLNYLPDCRVLVIAEALDDESLAVAVRAASYHGAKLVVLAAAGEDPPANLPRDATVLEAPAGNGAAFSSLVGRYAAALADGQLAEDAWQQALSESGWEESEAGS